MTDYLSPPELAEAYLPALPYLLGHDPVGHLVITGHRLRLPLWAETFGLDEPDLRNTLRARLARRGANATVASAFAPPGQAGTGLHIAAGVLHDLDLPVAALLSIDADTYYSADPANGRIGGPRWFDTATTTGVVHQQSYRRHLTRQRRAWAMRLTPHTDHATRSAITTATKRFETTYTGLVPRQVAACVEPWAIDLLDRALSTKDLWTPETVARLGIALRTEAVFAWARRKVTLVDEHQLARWIDLVRRVEPGYRCPPACLLALAAGNTGDPYLVVDALLVAFDDEPGNQLARHLAATMLLPPVRS